MRRSWGAAALWAGGCSLLFVAVYGACNAITSERTDVGTLCFDWELSIPFVPLMVIPYWSLDLFFAASFFLCRDRRELDCLGKRIVLAIVAAGTCFLLFPLRCVYPRPPVDGFLGTLFELLRGFDQPYNLFPSLHIALRTLLVGVFARRASGLGRLLLHAWFSLIGVSTVLTYQHHVIDVVGGFALALVCFYAIREESVRVPRAANPRVGAYYALGALVAAWLMTATAPAGLWLAWPAASLALVAGGYLGLGPAIYRKEGHAPDLSARLLLAPCLLGQHLSWLHYRRHSRAWDEVVPGVWIGRRLTDREAADATRAGVTAVLDLTAEFAEAAPFRGLAYRNLPVLDLTAPTPGQLREAAAFIHEQAGKGTVYVHCKVGYSRSAAAVGAYLLASGRAKSAEEAVGILRRARPTLVVRPEALLALREFEREERSL